MFVNYKLKKYKDQIGPRPHNAGDEMFSVHTTPRKLENATITGHFGLRLYVQLFREIYK